MTERITITATTKPSTPTAAPAYKLALTYVSSAAGGKALLGRRHATSERGYNTFFDARGVLDQEGFERWVGTLVGGAMEGKGE